jgi:phage shock protein B
MPDPMPWINFNVVAILGMSLLALIVLGIFVLVGMKIMRNGGKKRRRIGEDEETRMIQEMYQGMSRMEQRVEALETLLYDRKEERDHHEP